MELTLFALSSVGLTCIILESTLFRGVRDLLKRSLPEQAYELFECHQCMGTWVGFVLGYLLIGQSLVAILVSGFASSFLAMTYHRAFVLAEEWVLSHTSIELPEGPKGG